MKSAIFQILLAFCLLLFSTGDSEALALKTEHFQLEARANSDLLTGTFITRDSAGIVDGPNEYSYVRQNPWTMFDPDGLESKHEKKWSKIAHDDKRNIFVRFGAIGMTVAESLNFFRSDSSIRDAGHGMQKGFAESRKVLKKEAPPGIREVAQFAMGVGEAGTAMISGPAGIGEVGDSIQKNGVAETGKQMVTGMVDHAVNHPIEFSGQIMVGLAAGKAGAKAPSGKSARTLVKKSGKGAKGERKVFWSGGSQAKRAVEAYAKQTGGKTLEMTITGRFLDMITTNKTYPFLRPAWNATSKRFAKSAGSSTDVFHSISRGVKLESVWATKEYPLLLKQGTKINYHPAP